VRGDHIREQIAHVLFAQDFEVRERKKNGLTNSQSG
jgi:hypothetical protein